MNQLPLNGEREHSWIASYRTLRSTGPISTHFAPVGIESLVLVDLSAITSVTAVYGMWVCELPIALSTIVGPCKMISLVPEATLVDRTVRLLRLCVCPVRHLLYNVPWASDLAICAPSVRIGIASGTAFINAVNDANSAETIGDRLKAQCPMFLGCQAFWVDPSPLRSR